MPAAGFLALGGAERLYTRANIQGTGSPASWNGTAVVWVDASTNLVNAVASTASVPTYLDDPGDGNGPVAVHANNNGFVGGATGFTAYVGGTTWTAWAVVRASDIASYRNVFSSDTSTAGSLYGIGGRLYIEDGTTEDTGVDLSPGTDYRIALIRTATNYRLYVNGSLVYTTTGITPSATPTFVTASYGGDTNAPWTGWWYAWGVHSTDLSASIAALDAEMLAEINGAADVVDTTTTLSTASDVALRIGRRLAVTPAVTLETAADVALRIGRRLAVEPAVTLETAADFATSGGVTVNTATTLSTAADVALRIGRRLAVTPATTLSTAANVNLQRQRVLNVAAASSLETAADVALRIGRRMLVAAAVTLSTASDVNLGDPGIADDFADDGPLLNYETVNASVIADVSRTAGSYRAAVTGSTADTTAHYNALYGRGDGRVVSFVDGFDVIYRNCRVRTPSDPDTAPTLAGTEYLFCGVQANNDFLGTPTAGYQQLTGGHRGPNLTTEGGWTAEGKTTISSSSSVTDAGGDAIVTTKAIDIRVVGTSGPNTIAWYWRLTGDTAWIPYSMPGTAPTWGDEIHLVLITYAFGHFGPDFAGYIDDVSVAAPPASIVVGTASSLETAADVALRIGRRLAVTPATTLSTAASVNLQHQRVLNVAAAGSLETAADVALRIGRRLAVTPATTLSTAANVNLQRQRVLNVAAASSLETAADVALRIGRRLAVEPAVTLETAGPVILGATTLVVDTTTTLSTASDVALRIGRRLVVTPAVTLETAADVDLTISGGAMVGGTTGGVSFAITTTGTVTTVSTAEIQVTG